MAEPTNSRALGRLYNVWWDTVWSAKHDYPEAEKSLEVRDTMRRTIEQIKLTESFLWPTLEDDNTIDLVSEVDPVTAASISASFCPF